MSRKDGVHITETGDSIFGPQHSPCFNMNPLRREDGKYPSLIIVATNTGGGYKPIQVLLPHQLYLDDAQKILEEAGHGAELWVCPIYDSNDWTQVDVPQRVDNSPQAS